MTKEITFDREKLVSGTQFKLMAKAAMVAELHTNHRVIGINPTDNIQTYVVTTLENDDAQSRSWVVDAGQFANIQIRELSLNESVYDTIVAA